MGPVQRRQFLDELARSGDPEQAARTLNVSLVEAFRLRDADPAFGAQWQAAVGFAWELLEMRLLAELLSAQASGNGCASPEEPRPACPDGETVPPAPTANQQRRPKAKGGGRLLDRLDSRLTMAILNRRDPPASRSGPPRGPALDSAAVARLRAELRDLAEKGTKL